MTEVTHPSDGVYLSKFLAGTLSSILGVALVGTFVNLWQLNANAILFKSHLEDIKRPGVALPGAVSRREWDMERDNTAAKYDALSAQIAALSDKVDELKEKR